MGSTIQITHSKNLSFKKLSFLYLVFILFLFFSSPGQYVIHYTKLASTQTELNERLLTKLKSFKSEIPQELDLKNTTLECLNDLNKLETEYATYAEKNLVKGDKIKENNFAEKTVRRGPLSATVQGILNKYLSSFAKFSKKDLSGDLVSLTDFSQNNFKTIEFFFKETPNGVVKSIFEHFKTVFLYNSLVELTHQNIDLPKFELITINDANFIEKFRRSLVLGETLVLSIKPDKTGLIPTVKINGTLVDVKQTSNSIYSINYNPSKPGNYSLEVIVGEKRLLSGFNVLKPEFRFIMERSNLDVIVGSKCILSVDSQYIPSKGVAFVSSKATVERVKNALYITPSEAGVFEIQMKVDNQVVDKVILYARDPGAIEVGLMDISGQLASLDKANRLESTNTFWQVVNFQMTVVDPLGNKQTMKSATRYLRNELRDLEAKAPAGSTVVFDNIKLVGQQSGSAKIGQPIILVK
jgi:hypothetical protein